MKGDVWFDGARVLGLDVLAVLGVVHELVDRHVRPRAAALVDGGIARDAEEERDERQSAVLVSVERFHRADEHVSYQVLRLVFRAGPRQAVPKDRVAIALVKVAER